MSNPRSYFLRQIPGHVPIHQLYLLYLLAGLFALLLLFTHTSCSNDGSGAKSNATGPTGATPGGLQDLNNARELIDQGVVPPAEALLVEGLFSQHDLPLISDDCSEPLCLQGALGWQEGHGWLQLGLSSNIDMETFERSAQSLMLLIDVSGSMGWNYGHDGLPAEITRALANGLITRMDDEDDEVGIATFNQQAQSVQPLVSGSSQDLLLEKIETMATGGGTNMEAGLRLADTMISRSENETTQKRILLLTDAQPNIDATSPGSFMTLARDLAERDIGLTVIGCGLGLNPDLMSVMIDLQGANGFSLMNAEAVDGFFDDNWPYCVSPIATDLQVMVSPGPGFEMIQSYGFPGEGTGELTCATVFQSRRRGALLVELGGGSLLDLASTLTVNYNSTTGVPVEQTLTLQIPAGAEPDASGHYFTEYGVQKTTALALLMHDIHRAAEIYGEDPETAGALVAGAADRFASDLAALIEIEPDDEEALRTELEMAQALEHLMSEGARQGTLYGGF